MASLVIWAPFAFKMTVRNEALVDGSPPPSRAATSSWRAILLNTLARALSAAPFLCLIVAHLEWPDMGLSPFRTDRAWLGGESVVLQEHLVQACVWRDLWMEGRDHDVPLTCENRHVIVRGQHLYVGAGRLYLRCPDEHRVERTIQPGHRDVGLEAVDLAAPLTA